VGEEQLHNEFRKNKMMDLLESKEVGKPYVPA